MLSFKALARLFILMLSNATERILLWGNSRNTLDHLVRFVTFIRNAFAKKEHAMSIFFDPKRHMTQHGNMAF
jgi:hypothetical protein